MKPYPPKLWSEIKLAYESGEYRGFEHLHEKLSTSYQQFPAINVIEQRAAKEKWKKAALLPLIAEKKERNFIETFAALGIDDVAVAARVAQMLVAKKRDTFTGEVEDDQQAADKAITQFAKLTGAYSAEKSDVTMFFPSKIEIETIPTKKDA